MVNLLRKLFIKNYDDVKNQHVREAHGKMSSLVGVVSNLFLFAIKLVAGLFSKSLSIIADSVNNLSDMGSSVVTLIGFRMSNKPADKEHPYGHQRIEYIAGLIVSIIIIFVGGSLLFTSVEKIFNYDKENSTELCLTFYTYLVCRHSLKETAERLFTHRNTVQYRIKKLKDEFMIDPDDSDKMLSYILSLSCALFKLGYNDIFK